MSTTIEEGLTTFFLATAGITALVGTRVWGSRVKQGSTFPCITKQRISTPRIHTHDESGSSGMLARPRFQIDVWGASEASVKAVADAIRTALNGKVGSLGAGCISIQAALAEEEVLEYDPETDIYRVRCEYIIWQLE
jgi:hypothetical protein